MNAFLSWLKFTATCLSASAGALAVVGGISFAGDWAATHYPIAGAVALVVAGITVYWGLEVWPGEREP